MQQVLQNLNNGKTFLECVPAPKGRAGQILVSTSISLLSIGTEKMLVDFGNAGWIAKARSQPDKVRQVLEKIKTDGLLPTIEAVRAKLDQPIPLGYCNVGTVLETGSEMFRLGDRVVSNGPHAEVVSMGANLCAKIPASVSDEEAAFTILGAIGLQGVRLLVPTLGECFVVTGLGLIGLLCVQILRANCCRVLGIDFDSRKCALAQSFGAETVDLSKGQDPLAAAQVFSNGRGVDGVLITAATASHEPVHQGALMCRKRGRIVLVGVVGLNLSRADFYEKELTFQVSCSYGPGRYDDDYEKRGNDYPIGFVRWTEQRNFEAVLQLMAERRIDVAPLITHRFKFEEAPKAYEAMGDSHALGIILEYPGISHGSSPNVVEIVKPVEGKTVSSPKSPASLRAPVVGLLGAGGFSAQVLLPALIRTGVRLESICSASGVSGTHLAKKFGFTKSTTDAQALLADPQIDTVLITTRHNSHASLVCQALEAGKNVFVEKPLCLTREQLRQIGETYQAQARLGQSPFLMIGFNRRFSPQIQKMKELLEFSSGPKTLVMTVNAGAIPANHWINDPEIGGGRIIGEGCHFVDLLRFLVGKPIRSVSSTALTQSNSGPTESFSTTLGFEGGSVGTLHYFANGHKSFPKEHLEVFADGRVLRLENFRRMEGFGWPRFKNLNLWRQDKGHKGEMAALATAIAAQTGSPIPFHEIVEVTEATFQIAESASKSSTKSLCLSK